MTMNTINTLNTISNLNLKYLQSGYEDDVYNLFIMILDLLENCLKDKYSKENELTRLHWFLTDCFGFWCKKLDVLPAIILYQCENMSKKEIPKFYPNYFLWKFKDMSISERNDFEYVLYNNALAKIKFYLKENNQI